MRLADNPALLAAQARQAPVLPLFIWAPAEEGKWSPGQMSRCWLRSSLVSLTSDLKKLKSNLVIRQGDTFKVLLSIIKETGAQAVLWNSCYEPVIRERDRLLKVKLRQLGLEVESFNAALLKEPTEVLNKQGSPYRVFTPFWQSYLAEDCRSIAPLPDPDIFRPVRLWPQSLLLEDLPLTERNNWQDGCGSSWQPGCAGAKARLTSFLTKAIDSYAIDRDHANLAGVSRLSPHLHFGEIGPRQIFSAVYDHVDLTRSGKDAQAYLKELGWREFAYHSLYHYPQTPDAPLIRRFRQFPWRKNEKLLQAWQDGMTGYPIVDAGMRELLATGWMHNRVRMIVASFLVKDLMVSWQDGAAWFWQNLADADLANNTLNWQWVAGCGADAAPYFRIFNPLSQSRRFDAKGDYIRKWLPELANLSAPAIYAPWLVSEEILQRAHICLGKSYPKPLVDHKLARIRALRAFSSLQSESDVEAH